MAKHPTPRHSVFRLPPPTKKKPLKRHKTSKLLIFNTILLLTIFLLQISSGETYQRVKELIILTKGILY